MTPLLWFIIGLWSGLLFSISLSKNRCRLLGHKDEPEDGSEVDPPWYTR